MPWRSFTQKGALTDSFQSSPAVKTGTFQVIAMTFDEQGRDEVFIENLTIQIERSDADPIGSSNYVRTIGGIVIAENDRHAWKGPNRLFAYCNNGINRIGDAIEIPYQAFGKGGNGHPVPELRLTSVKIPFADIKKFEIIPRHIEFNLDEG